MDTHKFIDGKWVRSEGLLLTEIEEKFPFLSKVSPIVPSVLMEHTASYFFTSTIPKFAARFKHLLLNTPLRKRSIKILRSYDLIDILFEKFGETGSDLDGQYTTIKAISGLYKYDLIVLIVGIAEPTNKYLPEVIVQLIEGRALEAKATWVVSPMAPAALRMQANSTSKLCDTYKNLPEVVF